MTMEFLRQNEFNTTTQIAVLTVNSDLAENLFDRDPKNKYFGNTDTAEQRIVISFSSAVVIDTIFLQKHNLKGFSIHPDGTTTNNFTPAITTTNSSDTSSLFTFATQTVNSVLLIMSTTSVGNALKEIGQLFIGSLLLNFERNPTAADYKPITTHKQVVHKMPNGGVNQFIVDDKFKGQIKWKFVTNSFTSQLEDIFDTGTALYFVPFPTTTSWDGKAFEVAWTNNFDFRHSSDNKVAGQGGKIILEETA